MKSIPQDLPNIFSDTLVVQVLYQLLHRPCSRTLGTVTATPYWVKIGHVEVSVGDTKDITVY